MNINRMITCASIIVGVGAAQFLDYTFSLACIHSLIIVITGEVMDRLGQQVAKLTNKEK